MHKFQLARSVNRLSFPEFFLNDFELMHHVMQEAIGYCGRTETLPYLVSGLPLLAAIGWFTEGITCHQLSWCMYKSAQQCTEFKSDRSAWNCTNALTLVGHEAGGFENGCQELSQKNS